MVKLSTFVLDASHKFQIHVSDRSMTMKISECARANFCMICTKMKLQAELIFIWEVSGRRGIKKGMGCLHWGRAVPETFVIFQQVTLWHFSVLLVFNFLLSIDFLNSKHRALTVKSRQIQSKDSYYGVKLSRSIKCKSRVFLKFFCNVSSRSFIETSHDYLMCSLRFKI